MSRVVLHRDSETGVTMAPPGKAPVKIEPKSSKPAATKSSAKARRCCHCQAQCSQGRCNYQAHQARCSATTAAHVKNELRMKKEAGMKKEFWKQEAGTLGAGSSSSLMALPVASCPNSDSPGGGSDVEAGN